MARLVVVTHKFDIFKYRIGGPQAPVTSPYLLFDVLRHLQALGHTSVVTRGPRPLPGDVAMLHVDSTIVDEEYLALASRYAATINFRTRDISKRRVSRSLLSKGDDWDGKVIVKGNLNSGGYMEANHNEIALKFGFPQPHPGISKSPPYQVHERLKDVPEEVWNDKTLVVEKFIPEPDADGGFALHTWVFIGSSERCTRMVTSSDISKAGDVLRYAPVEVPPQLRAERERLGFDFGKFDFVMRDGEQVLLDANRTPGVAIAIRPLMEAGAPKLAEGLDQLIKARLREANSAA
jgi:hypothetical protein